MHESISIRKRSQCLSVMASVALAAGLILSASGRLGRAQVGPPLAPTAIVSVQGNFAGNGSKVAKDLSGIACRPVSHQEELECLVINDEGRAAQRATLRDAMLIPGSAASLIDNVLPPTALGTPPTISTCPGGPGHFGEFDGEGVAFASAAMRDGGAFYVVGSHGCSRNKAEFRLSSFLLARLRINQNGDLAPAELTWRLSNALRAAPTVGVYFGRALSSTDQGLNIEGIAAIGDLLFLGFRGPSRDGTAYIVRTSISDSFAPGQVEGTKKPDVFPVALGPNAGVRDIAALPDGRLLVLSGPAQEQKEVPYALALVTLDTASLTSTIRWLGSLQDLIDGGERAKAEAIAVAGQEGDALRVVILFDGPRNGAPREYQVRIQH